MAGSKDRGERRERVRTAATTGADGKVRASKRPSTRGVERWPGRTREIAPPPIAELNARAAALRGGGAELIDLGQAVLGLAPPAAALARVVAWMANREPQTYSPDPGLSDVRQAVADFLEAHKGIRRNAGATDGSLPLLTCGCNQAYATALLAVTRPGDEVIVLSPYYFDHVFAIQLAGCRTVDVALAFDGASFRIDFDRLEHAVTRRTRVITLVSPGNPTASVATQGEVERLTCFCHDRGLWLLSDETYDLLALPPAETCSPAAVSDHDRIVTMGSFSKTLALAAWRVGYLHGSRRFVDEALKVQDALVVCAPVPAQRAVLGALEVLPDWLPSLRSELALRHATLLAGLKTIPWLVPVRAEGGTFLLARYLGFPDSMACCVALLEQAGVVTVPGGAFGPAGDPFVRFSFGNQPAGRLAEAVERIRAMRSPVA